MAIHYINIDLSLKTYPFLKYFMVKYNFHQFRKYNYFLSSCGLPWAFIDAVENMGIINNLEMKL